MAAHTLEDTCMDGDNTRSGKLSSYLAANQKVMSLRRNIMEVKKHEAQFMYEGMLARAC